MGAAAFCSGKLRKVDVDFQWLVSVPCVPFTALGSRKGIWPVKNPIKLFPQLPL